MNLNNRRKFLFETRHFISIHEQTGIMNGDQTADPLVGGQPALPPEPQSRSKKRRWRIKQTFSSLMDTKSTTATHVVNMMHNRLNLHCYTEESL